MSDPVNNPQHYQKHPSGVECIEVTRHLSFNRGNAFKYIFRHKSKGHPEQDLQKALWYIRDEIRAKGKIVNPNEYRRRALLKIHCSFRSRPMRTRTFPSSTSIQRGT